MDMQRIFSADGPWPAPWMERVLPVVATLANRHRERTVFTRFILPSARTRRQVCGSAITHGGGWRPANAST